MFLCSKLHWLNMNSKPVAEAGSEAFERFCLVLSRLPEGRVCSYGHLSQLADLGGARQTCRQLRKLSRDSGLPWYRVVSAGGKLADFASAGLQRQLLEAEGIVFTPKGRIPKSFYWASE